MKKLLIKATTIPSVIALLSFCGCADTSNKVTLGEGTNSIESSITPESKTTSEVSKETSKTEASKAKEVSKEASEISKPTESSIEDVESFVEESEEIEPSIEESYEEEQESEDFEDYSLTITSDDYDYAAAPNVEFEEEEEITYDYSYSYPTYYTPNEFYNMGIIEWGGWSWTYYSEVYMLGTTLPIPGRWTDENGYVCDENNYICLASSSLPKGTIVDTPFGKMGKVYDCGCLNYILDVYVNWT